MRNFIALAALLCTVHAAHADTNNDDEGALATGLARAFVIGGSIEATPLALGLADIVVRPESRTYGGIEVAAASIATAFNIYTSIDFLDSNCADCARTLGPYVAGLTLVDIAVGAHGVWLLRKDRPDPTEINVGSVRGRVAPTMVGDGRTNVAGLGFAGRF